MIACTYFQQSFTCEMSSKEFLSENSNGSSFLEEGEEMKNLGKYIVTLFEKADNFSNLSNLAFWKFTSFYVKDYPKQESIKIHMYIFYVTFHHFCLSKCILYFTLHTSNKV